MSSSRLLLSSAFNAATLLDHHDCRRNIAGKSTIVHIDDGARGWNASHRVEASVRVLTQ
jgi:hypothetical protein